MVRHIFQTMTKTKDPIFLRSSETHQITFSQLLLLSRSKPDKSLSNVELENDNNPHQLKQYEGKVDKLNKDLASLWLVKWGQCSKTVTIKLEGNFKLLEWKKMSIVTALFNEIQLIWQNYDRKKTMLFLQLINTLVSFMVTNKGKTTAFTGM